MLTVVLPGLEPWAVLGDDGTITTFARFAGEDRPSPARLRREGIRLGPAGKDRSQLYYRAGEGFDWAGWEYQLDRRRRKARALLDRIKTRTRKIH